MIFGVSNNFYKDCYSVNNAANSKETVDKFMTNSFYELQADSVLSTIRVETGESIGIYYDETSTAANPIMLAKVKGQDGNIQEIKVAVNEVDPSNASYVEMIALSAHLKTEGKIDGPAGAFATMVFHSRVKEANNNSIYEKENFLPAMTEMVENALKDGQMDTYLRYLKELNLYKSWAK